MVAWILLILMIFAAGPAYAQFNEGCATAVDFGKRIVNTCIADGGATCRTQAYLDVVWLESIVSDRALLLGGCTKDNLLYFYMDSSANTVTSNEPDYDPTSSDNFTAQEEFLANERANAAANAALNPFGRKCAPRPNGGCETAPAGPGD